MEKLIYSQFFLNLILVINISSFTQGFFNLWRGVGEGRQIHCSKGSVLLLLGIFTEK